MTDPQTGYSRGGVDLSQLAGDVQDAGAAHSGAGNRPYGAAPSGMPAVASGPTVAAPLITDVTEQNLEDTMALSQTVPVVLVLHSPKSIASKQALQVVEQACRDSVGAFQVGKLDVETNPTLASAFQAQVVPSGFALVARRPVPLFEGVPTETQLAQVLDDLFQVAPQLGVVGRIEVSADDLETPTPPEHIPAREAEERGDWAAAIAEWKKVLANSPKDQEAKTALTRAQFEDRQGAREAGLTQSSEGASVESDNSSVGSIEARADSLFALGQEAAAFDLLLGALEEENDSDARESLRARIVELFQIASDTAVVKSARTRLATILMV